MLKSLFNSSQQRLFKAIQSGDPDKVARLLPKLAPDDLCAPDDDGVHALEHALQADTARILTLLLSKAASPLPTGRCGTPLIVLALQHEDSLPRVNALLQAGEDANLSHEGQPLLHHCARDCTPQRLMVHVSRLLEYGADINAADEAGMTLMAKLMPRGDQALLQFLIQSGAECEEAWLERLDDQALATQLRRIREDLRIRQMMLGG